MKKGFTLIELLATIVILIIIILIAVPIILNIVEISRRGAAEASAIGYISAVEKQAAINQIDKESKKISPGVYTVKKIRTI